MAVVQTITAVLAKAPCTDWSGLCWIEAHPGLAGWAQAIGTLAALGVAIAVPWTVARLRVRRHRQIGGQVAADCIASVEGIVRSILKRQADGLPVHFGVAELSISICAASMTSFPRFELGSAEIVAAWEDVFAHMQIIQRVLIDLAADDTDAEAYEMLQLVAQALSGFGKRLRELLPPPIDTAAGTVPSSP